MNNFLKFLSFYFMLHISFRILFNIKYFNPFFTSLNVIYILKYFNVQVFMLWEYLIKLLFKGTILVCFLLNFIFTFVYTLSFLNYSKRQIIIYKKCIILVSTF